MEHAVDAMSDDWDDLINAATDFLRQRAASGGLHTPEKVAAMQGLYEKWEFFKETCDRAEDLVLTARRELVGELASVVVKDGNDDDDDVNSCRIVKPSNADDSTSDATAPVAPTSPSLSAGTQESRYAVAE